MVQARSDIPSGGIKKVGDTVSVFALISGKSNQENGKNKIERHLLSLTKKKSPTILFCPYAALNDIQGSILKFQELMRFQQCRIINLTLDNLSRFEEYLSECDIFYISGGNCEKLIRFFKENGLDSILKCHIQDDKIFAGSSAGAMLYTLASMGDGYVFSDNFHRYNFKMVDCLDLLRITICPHYQQEDLILYNDILKGYPCDAFGIEEDTMLVIEENKFYVVKEERSKSVYYFDKRKNYRMLPLYEGVLYEKDSSFRSGGDI